MSRNMHGFVQGNMKKQGEALAMVCKICSKITIFLSELPVNCVEYMIKLLYM